MMKWMTVHQYIVLVENLRFSTRIMLILFDQKKKKKSTQTLFHTKWTSSGKQHFINHHFPVTSYVFVGKFEARWMPWACSHISTASHGLCQLVSTWMPEFRGSLWQDVNNVLADWCIKSLLHCKVVPGSPTSFLLAWKSFRVSLTPHIC